MQIPGTTFDFSLQEAMHPHELQHLLRELSPASLGGAVVDYPSETSKEITPWMVKISGAINVYGETLYWETQQDIRYFEKAEDVLLLVDQLNKSFDKAAESWSQK